MKKEILFLKVLALMAYLLSAFSTMAQEAYAEFTANDSTLTFYYDNLRSTRTGTTYGLGGSYDDYPSWFLDEELLEFDDEGDYNSLIVRRVVFNPSFAAARPKTTNCWFCNMRKLEAITGLEYLNTSEVTNMICMFEYCNSLMSLDLSHIDTGKVTNMDYMFDECRRLMCLDLSTFNTANVTNMNCMFACCSNLNTIYVGSGWSTVSLSGEWSGIDLFFGCTNLVGGMGTAYDWGCEDAEYAHIDGGPENPGYFTAAPTALPGDVDGDGQLGIADVTVLVDLLLNGDEKPAVADVDGNGTVGIADVTALIDLLLSGDN